MDPSPFSGNHPNLFSNVNDPYLFSPKATSQPSFVAVAPPSMAPPPVARSWFTSRTAIFVFAIVLALLFMAYYFRDRLFAKKTPQNPYAAGINAITNPNQQADLREWVQLWQISRRPNVKRVLTDVLNAELGAPAEPTATTTATTANTAATTSDATAANSALPPPAPASDTTDPAFTVQ